MNAENALKQLGKKEKQKDDKGVCMEITDISEDRLLRRFSK
ncbi:hypothetical protein [Candidatus Alkanophaga liquidiphilum]|nr:hypothetical protein [Candidatus Alkanophaga liquidiphilum]